MYDMQQKMSSLEKTPEKMIKEKLNCFIFVTLGQNKLRKNLIKLKSGELDSCGANKKIYLCPQMTIELEDATMICPQIEFQKSGHPTIGIILILSKFPLPNSSN
jgi:hypothetical protein